jgi:hypothetical protein
MEESSSLKCKIGWNAELLSGWPAVSGEAMMETPVNEFEGRAKGTKPLDLTWIVGVGLILLGALYLFGQLIGMDDLVWAISLMGVGATFTLVFLTERTRWWALIPAYIFSVVGAFILVEPLLWGDADAVYWLMAVGLPFLTVYLTNTRRWWALIPAYIMIATAVFLMVEPILWGDMDAAYWLFATGAPFLVVYAGDMQKRRWALIPVYIFGVTGLFLLVEPIMWGDLDAAYWLAAIAVPFFVVFFSDIRKRWWALIPAGVMASAALAVLIAELELLIPVILIAGGLFLLVRRGTARRQMDQVESPPLTGPAADRPPEVEVSVEREIVG